MNNPPWYVGQPQLVLSNDLGGFVDDKRHIFLKLRYINREVILVRYAQFYPEDKVITIVEYDGVPSGFIGRIERR